MKKIKFDKKLSLNKETVALLNREQMASLKGGLGAGNLLDMMSHTEDDHATCNKEEDTCDKEDDTCDWESGEQDCMSFAC